MKITRNLAASRARYNKIKAIRVVLRPSIARTL